MDGSIKRVGPLALTATPTTNLYQGGNGSALIYDVITRLHFVNKTGANHPVSVWLGATGGNVAGTELLNGHIILANQEFEWPCNMKMLSTDFLVGSSDAVSSVTLMIESKQFVVPQ